MGTEGTPPLGLRWTRSLFFSLCAFASVRFLAKGWVHEFYLAPAYHFTWPGFAFVRPLPDLAMHGVFVLMAISATCAAVGIYFRPCAWLFVALFSYVELLDRTYYLNHYYLVTLMAVLFATGPPLRQQDNVPENFRNLLRFQVGIVYQFAGLAKLNHDFLVRGEPLHTWLLHHATLPLLGSTLALPEAAVAMAWAGTIFDLAVVPALLWSPTRTLAYAAVVIFHVTTGLLFDIGMFPAFMIILATVYLSPQWPANFLEFARHTIPNPTEHTRPAALHWPCPRDRWVKALVTAALPTYVACQTLIPLRHFAYPGHTNWTEEGFRFAWRVMLIEKTGHVEFWLHDEITGTRHMHGPRETLTHMQTQMMSTQPDMLAQYAQHLANQAQSATGHLHQVFVDSRVSLNGNHPSPLVRAHCNLAVPWPLFLPAPCITRD